MNVQSLLSRVRDVAATSENLEHLLGLIASAEPEGLGPDVAPMLQHTTSCLAASAELLVTSEKLVTSLTVARGLQAASSRQRSTASREQRVADRDQIEAARAAVARSRALLDLPVPHSHPDPASMPRETAREVLPANTVRLTRTGSSALVEACGPDPTPTSDEAAAPPARAKNSVAETAPAPSVEPLLAVAEAATDVIWSRDAATLRWDYLGPGCGGLYGVERADLLAAPDPLKAWLDVIAPDDRDRVVKAMALVRAGQPATYAFRVRAPGQAGDRWVRHADFPVRDETGCVIRIAGIASDITAEKDHAARLAVMCSEGQHRLRNLIGIVTAVSNVTARTSSDLAAFRRRFGGRLDALARVQDFLTRRDGGRPVTVGEVIGAELAAVAGGSQRVTLHGLSHLSLPATAVQTFALALHELFTNATKHGALGRPGGRLAISWYIDQTGDKRWLRMDWRETGVANTSVTRGQADRGGAGRELIEKALPYALHAETQFTLEPDGVHCTVALPLAEPFRPGAGEVPQG